MAFLGDFGRYFLGGARTGDVARTAAVALGANPLTAGGIGAGAQMAADDISRRSSEGETTQTQTDYSSS